MSIKKEMYPDSSGSTTLPGHTITVVPPLIVHNLLPVELQVVIPSACVSERIVSGKDVEICVVREGFFKSDANELI